MLAGGGGMNILVVDDDADQRLVLRNVLTMEGWTVFLAENGEEALAKVGPEKIDLIVSDIYMPVMDGIKFHKTLREIPAFGGIPFLFISAYDDQHTLDAVKNPKIEGFYRKGRPVAELKEWVLYLTTPEDLRPKFPPGRNPLR
jgi:two-component system chemotaxis response regulator CheY